MIHSRDIKKASVTEKPLNGLTENVLIVNKYLITSAAVKYILIMILVQKAKGCVYW